MTAVALINGSNSWNARSSWNFFISIQFTKDCRAEIVLDKYQKRIGVSFSGNKDIHDLFKKKLNIHRPMTNKHSNNAQYDFKYSSKNCDRIVKMLTLCFSNTEYVA